MSRRALALCGTLGLAMLTACQSQPPRASAAARSAVSHACPPAIASSGARCLSVPVPRDYRKLADASIDLDVIVFPALEPGADKAAQFDLQPGNAFEQAAAFYTGDGLAYRRYRDVVVMPVRNWDGADSPACEAVDARAAARDVESVRFRLGYAMIDLSAASCAATVALRVVTDAAPQVRTAVLKDPRPPFPDSPQAGGNRVPLLLLSGATDPATLAGGTQAVTTRFPGSWQLILPAGQSTARGISGLDSCVDRLILKFIAARSVDNVDDFCFAAMTREPSLSP